MVAGTIVAQNVQCPTPLCVVGGSGSKDLSWQLCPSFVHPKSLVSSSVQRANNQLQIQIRREQREGII